MPKDRRGFSTRWFVQTIVQIAVVVGMLLGGFWKIQDSINGANMAAMAAQAAAAAAVKDVEDHDNDINVHMPMEQKIEMFVPRREVEATLKAINDNLTGIRTEFAAFRQQMYSANGGGAP